MEFVCAALFLLRSIYDINIFQTRGDVNMTKVMKFSQVKSHEKHSKILLFFTENEN